MSLFERLGVIILIVAVVHLDDRNYNNEDPKKFIERFENSCSQSSVSEQLVQFGHHFEIFWTFLENFLRLLHSMLKFPT